MPEQEALETPVADHQGVNVAGSPDPTPSNGSRAVDVMFTTIRHQSGEDLQGKTCIQFLAHAVEVFGMEVFDLEHQLALLVHLFDRPALVVEVGEFLRGVDLAIRQRGHEHPIATGALDQAHRESLQSLARNFHHPSYLYCQESPYRGLPE